MSSSSPTHPLLSTRLTADHDTSSFVSGADDLDDWLRRSALNSDAAGNSRTWVWAPSGKSVVAYYSLAPHVVRREDMPKKVARGSMRDIPSILLARLALTESLHGRRLGSALLADALTRILRAIDAVGGSLIVVDAIDDQAARFYEHHGFVPVPTDPLRLAIKASRVRASI